MKKEKKPKHDTVPEIYMGSSDSIAFFTQNYPVDSGPCATDVVPYQSEDSIGPGDYENTRIEHYL